MGWQVLSVTPYESSAFLLQFTSKFGKNIQQFDWALDKYDFSEFISQEMIDDYRNEYTPNKFRTEIEGEFISDSSFIFGEFKECIIEPEDKIPVYAGIDFGAGTGADSTVVTFFNKYRQVILIL